MSNLLIISLAFVICVLYALAMSLAVAYRISEEDHERMIREWTDGSRPETTPAARRPRSLQPYRSGAGGSDSGNGA